MLWWPGDVSTGGRGGFSSEQVLKDLEWWLPDVTSRGGLSPEVHVWCPRVWGEGGPLADDKNTSSIKSIGSIKYWILKQFFKGNYKENNTQSRNTSNQRLSAMGWIRRSNFNFKQEWRSLQKSKGYFSVWPIKRINISYWNLRNNCLN